jgi:hypothetical protein
MRRLFFTLVLCLLTTPAWALQTPTWDNTTDTSATAFTNSQNPSFSHTRGSSCPNPVTMISIALQDSTPGTLNTVTSGGSGATLIDSQNLATSNRNISLWIFKNPPSGASTIQANFSEVMNGVTISASTYCNVDQTTSTGTLAKARGNGTTATVNVTSAAGELVIDAVYVQGNTALTIGGGQTQRYNQNGSADPSHRSSEEAGAASVTMSWTWTGAVEWAILGVPLKPGPDPTSVGGPLRRRLP